LGDFDTMNFWLRNLTFTAILGITAFFLLANQDDFLALIMGDEVSTETTEAQTTDNNGYSEGTVPTKKTVATKKKTIPKKKTNAAADGLSKFYASINPDMNTKGPRIKKNVVYLPDPKGDLVKILEGRRMVVRPYRKNWKGSKESRPFRKGNTLYQKLSEYAGNDNLEVIWWLNRDFVIKDAFRINKNIIDTAYSVGKAVEGHFQGGMHIFFCYSHRALVLIDEPTEYLNDECLLLTGTKPRY
jgi:hypothetical protein